MKKTALIILLALSLLLSGCSLVVKDPVVDAGRTVLDVNGQVMTKQEMLIAYNQEVNLAYQMQQYYQMMGMQAPPLNPDELLTKAKDTAVRAMVISQQADKQGLSQLTQEEQKDLDQRVDENWQMLLDQVKAQYLPETELTGDELSAELERLAADLGQRKEDMASGIRDAMVADKLEEETTKDIQVSDEDVKADFDAKVEENKAAWEKDANAYGSAVNSRSTVYYAPAGYRMVKQVLVKFLPEDQTVIDEKNDADAAAQRDLAAAQSAKDANDTALAAEDLSEEDKQSLTEKAKELEAALKTNQTAADEARKALDEAKAKGYENIKQKAQEIFDSAATRPFDELVKEFNEDPGQPESGYAIREGFSSFDEAFVKPAMALQNVGDVAEPSPGAYGYYIVQYAADVAEGPVPFETVKDKLHDALLNTRKSDAWEAQVQAWIDASDIKEYMDRMKD